MATQTPQTTVFDGHIPPDVVRYMVYAQLAYPDKYAAFVKDLELKGVIWDFDTPAFRQAVGTFISTIKADEGQNTKIESAVPQSVIAPLVEELERVRERKTINRKEFVQQLATNYVNALREQAKIDLRDEESKRLIAELENQENLRLIAEHLEQGRPVDAKELITEANIAFTVATKAAHLDTKIGPELAEAITRETPGVVRYLEQTTTISRVSTARQADIVKATLTAEEVTRRDVYAKVLTELVAENPSVPIETLAQKTHDLTLRAEPLLADAIPDRNQIPYTNFFSSYTKAPKILATIGDGIFNALPHQTREAIVIEGLARAFEAVRDNPQLLIDRLGQKAGTEFVNSALFRHLIDQGNRNFAGERAQSRQALHAIPKVMTDTFFTVFGAPNETAMAMFELNKLHVFDVLKKNTGSATTKHAAPAGTVQTHFRQLAWGGGLPHLPTHAAPIGRVVLFGWETPTLYLSQMNAANPGLFSYALELGGNWIFQFGNKKIVTKGAELAVKKGAMAVAGKVATKGLAAPLAAIPVIGPILSGAWLLFGDVILGKLWGGIKWIGSKIFNLVTLDFLQNLIFGDHKSDWRKDGPLLMAGAIILAIVLLFVLPWSGNTQYIKYAADTSALAVGAGGPEEGDPNIVTPEYPQEACDPAKSSCRWPTVGCITQGPYTRSSHKGEAANAIDIGAASGTTIISTINGSVVEVYNECDDNTGYIGNKCGRGYGNQVIIESTDGSVKLMYTHVSKGSMPPVGTPLTIGQPVGNVDQNGNSSGSHLHYQLLSARHINSLLPFLVPSCVDDCNSQLVALGNSCQIQP